jgi:hypothetical protein
MAKVIIYGIECKIPDAPKLNEIDKSSLSLKKQMFKRIDIPESFYDIEIDDDGVVSYSDEQISFITREVQRCRNGYWFMNKGVPTYITGTHYFYLNYWYLESGIQPEYRDSDRKWFIFEQECEEDPNILGIIRVKKRREGATSQSSCVLTKKASMNENTRCGIISKTGGDASDLFQNMVVYGFRALPSFLQPRTDGVEDPKKRLVFVKQGKKKANNKGLFNKREGLNSFIEWRNTALNSFDSGRWSILLIDEASKFPAEVNIVEYWNIAKKTLTEGAKKVGFGLMVSTVNPPNNGGQPFKELWDKSNQFSQGRITESKLVRYFAPASEGLAGFIDEYGFSQIKEAEEFILANYRSNEQDIRDYPLSEEDAFKFNQNDCYFNLDKILAKEESLRMNPIHLRRGRFYFDGEGKVQWADDSSGGWLIRKFPKEANQFIVKNNVMYPMNTSDLGCGVDPFKNEITSGEGSKGSIWIGSKFDITNPEETGMPIAHYYGRPKLKKLFWKDVLMGSMYYGVPATIELDAGDDYYEYFRNNETEKNCLPMLGKKPDAVINPDRKTKTNFNQRGISSADPFSLSKQLEYGINYIEHHCDKIDYPDLLDELKRYDHSNRTKFDRTVSFLIMLLTLTGQSKAQKELKKRQPLIETFTVNNFNKFTF